MKMKSIFLALALAAADAGDFSHRVDLARQTSNANGPTTQRWVGTKTSDEVESIGKYTCAFSVPYKGPMDQDSNEVHYLYCDQHNNLDFSVEVDGKSVALFHQMVPQLMRGNAMCETDKNFVPSNKWLDDWHIQAQYVWKGEDGKIYAAMGPLIKVGEGDPVKIEVSWSHPDPLLSRRNFEIKIGTPQTSESTLTVDRPFMGTVSKYDQDYGPSAPSIFRKWEMSQVWEAWGMNDAKYYDEVEFTALFYDSKPADPSIEVCNTCTKHVGVLKEVGCFGPESKPMVSKIKTKKSVDKRKQVVVLTISRKAGSQLAARLADAADSVAVRAPTLVAVCVLAGVALGGLLTVLAPKAKEPTEHELLLASAAKV